MEFKRCLGASTEQEKGRQEGGEDHSNNASSNAVHEELDLVQMYLTCLPERYMKAKFTLTAYRTCWLLLKLCKKAYEKRLSASEKEELILDQLIDKAADWRIREELLMQLGSLTLARAVELGSQMERALQKTCPRFISVLTKQWESWSGSTRMWKIRNENCSNQWYCWGQKKSLDLTTKYDQEKQNQFIPSCHSPVSSALVMGRQQLDWQLRCPTTSNTNHGRARKFQTPEPAENYISEGEFEDDLNSSTPSTIELEIRGSSQETDEDYFETQSHQSGSLSDVKTEPYESVSDTESVSSDITGETCLDPNCLFTEKKNLCCSLPKAKAETALQELKCSRQPEFTQQVWSEVSSKIKATPSKTEFCIQSAKSEGEELHDEELTLTSDISNTENQVSEEDIISQIHRKFVAVLQNKAEFESSKVQSCANFIPIEDGVTRQKEHPAVLSIACFKANSESSLIFPEVQKFSFQSDAASSCSLPNLRFETDGPNRKSDTRTSDYKCELDSMCSIKCSKRNSVDSEETTGKTIKHEGTETMLTSESFFYQTCFNPKSQPPLRRSEITEGKTWHSVPENISAQSRTEYIGNCIHLTDKFRWSCSRVHLQGLDFEYTWKNLGRVPVSHEKAIKIEGKFDVERSLLNTDKDSNDCQLSQPAGSPQCADYDLQYKSEMCGLSPEAADTCADILTSTQTDAFVCNLKQKETSSALNCEPLIRNAEELIKSHHYKAERDLEADRSACDIDVQPGIGDTENLAGSHVAFPPVVENRDCDCAVNCVSICRTQQKCLKGSGLESELSGTEVVVGKRWVDDSSNLDFGCKVLEATMQPGGSSTEAEHKESMQQSTGCKTGALRNRSDLVTNEHPAPTGKDEDSVFAVEMTPRSNYIGQRRHLMTLPELKPGLIIVSVEQKGLQSQTLNYNLPTEVVTGPLRNAVSKDLMSPHTVSKAHDEPERVLSESCSCEEQILATHLIPGGAEVLPGRDTAEEKTEVSQEKREETDAVSSSGLIYSNSMVTSAKVEFESVTVPLDYNTLIAESQADQCEEAVFKSHSRSGVMISEKEPCRTKTGFEIEREQLRRSWAEIRDDQVSKEEEFKVHQGGEEGLDISSAVTLERCNVSDLCRGDGADADHQGPIIISEPAAGRQGIESCNDSIEQMGICEEPSPGEGKEGSPAEDTASPSKDSTQNPDVSDYLNCSVKRETHETCVLGLDNISTCSTNSEEMDENSFHIPGGHSSLYKAVQKPTKNGNNGKASRFLVFSKMTSFRKTKPAITENQGSSSLFGTKAKMEELGAGKEDEDTESLQSFKSCSSGSAFHRKESYTSEYSDDDDLFYERPAGLFNRMSLRKASGSGRILMEDVDTNSSSPTLAAVKYAEQQISSSSENNDSEPVEYSGVRKSFPENEYKRNKTPDGKKFKTRLALAHKSLSSLFESKSPEKENTEQSSRVSLKNEKEKARFRQSAWKAFLKSKEADGLRRPVLASLSPTQESATRGHVMRTTSVERQDSSNGHTFFKTETGNVSSTDTNYLDTSVEPVDVSSPAGVWRKRIQSYDLGIRYSQSSDCDEQQEALSNCLNTSLEEYWMKSPFSPTDLQSPFSQSSPSCPQLSNSDGKDMPCRPMSPKPQSPRSTSQPKSFRYPGRICATSMISLGNSSAVESSLEAPERPKTLKPRANAAWNLKKCESKQQCQTPPEKRPNEKWLPHRKRRLPEVPPSPHPISTLESKAWRLTFLAPDEKSKEIPERRRKRPKPLYKCFSFDDVWMERNQKRKLEKETQPERGIQLQHLPEDQLKAGISPSIMSAVALDILPLKMHPFSRSTPTGLDCMGWKRRISSPGLFQESGKTDVYVCLHVHMFDNVSFQKYRLTSLVQEGQPCLLGTTLCSCVHGLQRIIPLTRLSPGSHSQQELKRSHNGRLMASSDLQPGVLERKATYQKEESSTISLQAELGKPHMRDKAMERGQ
ncbi:hypothetical protein Q9233_014973 [Columba guinea]|nr:hypothetical protein Q9233_014973 [Columba guinea]